MTLARFGFIISIPMLLVGNPEAVNNTVAPRDEYADTGQ